MELVVDNFAGGGGASVGMEQGMDQTIDIAINHDDEAIAMHKANHPNTRHYMEDIWEVDPKEACRGQRVGLAWFSPDCKHFSRAKGSAPKRSKQIRGLAWVVLRWARAVRPRIIMLENVEEFRTWGPLGQDGRPIKARKGETFDTWARKLEREGYVVEFRTLIAADYGAPTTRKRLFMIARCDGQPIVWPAASHTKAEYKPAHSIIDWSLPCPSVFGRKRPLVKATMDRIAKGLERFVFNSSEPDPYIIRTGHAWKGGRVPGGWRGQPLESPLATVCATNDKALIIPFVARHWGGMVGRSINLPWPTVTSKGCQDQILSAFLIKYFGQSTVNSLNTPLGTLTSRDRYGLVTIKGEEYKLIDVGMRMLQPHELFAAQAFPADYIINPLYNGKPLTKTTQVRLCGNSVCPPIPAAMVAANYEQN